MSTYTPEQLEALAKEYEHGIPDHAFDNATPIPGTFAWLGEVIEDFDDFTAKMQAKGITLEEFLKRAVTLYIQTEQAA